MFTGIIEEVGTVLKTDAGILRIGAQVILEDAKLGDSIAINGVDLTVAEVADGSFTANVMPETYRRSNLGKARPSDRVNLERSLRPMDRISGHIIRGVVEGTGTVESFVPEADAVIATYQAAPALLRYMVVKGPVCIDGVSLTVIAKTERTFSVSLVQYTQEHTNLLDRQPNDTINLETDILARYVGALLSNQGINTEGTLPGA